MNILNPTVSLLRRFIKSKQVFYVLACILVLVLSVFSAYTYKSAPDNPAEQAEEQIIKDVFNVDVDLSNDGK